MSAPTPVLPACCPPACPSPLTVNIPGTPGEAGEQGAAGVNGYDSFTTVSIPFTVPAVGASVSVSVVNSLWAVIGQIVFGQFAGYYEVEGKTDSTTLVLKNLGYDGNAAPGVVIPVGSQIGPAGKKGLDGNSADALNDTSPTTTKGQLLVDNGANSPDASLVPLNVGADDLFLQGDSSLPEGLTYGNPALVSVLTGFSAATGGTVLATDTILQAIGRLENRTALNDAKVTGGDRVLKAGDTMTGVLQFSGTTHAGIILLSLTTAQRDALAAVNGMRIYNSTVNKFQSYENGTWLDDVGGAVDTSKVLKAGDTMTGLLQFSGTTHAGIQLISLTTAQRDALAPANGMVIYNSTLNLVQAYENASWSTLSNADRVAKSGDTMTGALVVQASVTLDQLIFTQATVTYAATTDIDFNNKGHQTISLTGNLTLTTSNRGAGKAVAVRLIADGSIRTLTFPAGWIFVGGAAPADIAANKTGILSLTAFGANDSDIIAAYAVEP